MSEQIFRVAIIGCGTISPMHANAIVENPQTQLIACADLDAARAAAFAEQYGCKAYTSAEELLANETLDAVHICTSHATHFPLLKLAAQKGLAVFTEKPPTTTRADFAELLALSQQYPIGVCFQNRYNDSVVAVKKRADAGEFGALQGARGFVTWHREKDYYQASPWRASLQQAAGGCLINQSIHTLDLMLQFLGKPDQIAAQTAQLRLADCIEVEDTLHALLTYQDGKRGVFYATNNYFKDERVIVELCFEQAIVRIEEVFVTVRWNDETGKETELLQFRPKDAAGKSYWGTSHARCINDFYKALATGQPFQNTPSNAKITMDTVFSVYESAKENGAAK